MFRWIEVGPRSDAAFCRTQVGSYRSFSLWWSTASVHLAVPGASQLNLGNRYKCRVSFLGGSSKPKNGPRNIQRVERDEPSGKSWPIYLLSLGVSIVLEIISRICPQEKRGLLSWLHCRDSHTAKFRNSGHIQKLCLPIGVRRLYQVISTYLIIFAHDLQQHEKWLSYIQVCNVRLLVGTGLD